MQLGIGLHAGGDLVVGGYIQIRVLHGFDHFFLGFQLQLLRLFLIFRLAQLLGKLIAQFSYFLIGFNELLQIVITDRRSSGLALFVLLRSTLSLGHDSRSADTEGGKGNGSGQCLEVVHG